MSAYAWDAEDYARHSTAQKRWAGELSERLALRGDERVLDLGCGDGLIAAQLATALPCGSVVGVDSSAAMIALARRRYPAERHPNLSFQIMDAQTLSFDARFDRVFSNAVLHWLKDHPAVLAGLHRSLRPGGKLLLGMGGQGDVADMRATLESVIAAAEWSEYFQDFEFPYTFPSPADYRHWLQAAGFSVRRAELLPKDATHDGSAGLAAWIRTTWLPYSQRLPESRREAFIQNVVEAYLLRIPLDDSGLAHVAMVLLEVEADKLGDERMDTT
ncbi:methyltransferase domain-containing protein [Methylomonas sp. EFPC3]|uniref:class I SAM-dependent methyltransferase n=1 Tax=Methylomonas sp. EFPC3 TaxID=3021710 RepID=UPI002416A5F9|nr:class I SAM-dependent methyltransferase [Methylomonas sp. EFPC3]WFP51083.1 methyltransferase domain-containing protein [Methylomonas sp. EFPC3]